MYAGLNAGRIDRTQPRSPATTTKTSWLEFSRQVLKPAVEAALGRLAAFTRLKPSDESIDHSRQTNWATSARASAERMRPAKPPEGGVRRPPT